MKSSIQEMKQAYRGSPPANIGPCSLVKPGRYSQFLDAPCGTVGLGPCVGLIVQMKHAQSYFVAHIECGEKVERGVGGQEMAATVKNLTSRRLTSLLVATSTVKVVAATSNLKEPSAIAILEGIKDWYGRDIEVLEQWSIVVTSSVKFTKLGVIRTIP